MIEHGIGESDFVQSPNDGWRMPEPACDCTDHWLAAYGLTRTEFSQFADVEVPEGEP